MDWLARYIGGVLVMYLKSMQILLLLCISFTDAVVAKSDCRKGAFGWILFLIVLRPFCLISIHEGLVSIRSWAGPEVGQTRFQAWSNPLSPSAWGNPQTQLSLQEVGIVEEPPELVHSKAQGTVRARDSQS